MEMKKVLIPIANGSEELEIVAVADTLTRAGAEVTIASINDELQIIASRNVKIVADKLLTDCIAEIYDLIVLPGGALGSQNLGECSELITMLQQQQQAGRFYAAICAAPAEVLQRHGLLTGLRATCYPHPDLTKQIEHFDSARVVVDQNCITSQGPGTALEFALKLVELLFNKNKAEQIAQEMLVGN